MKDFATKYIKWYESIPTWAKALLCFFWAIPAGLYRFSKSALQDNSLGMVLAVVVTLVGGEVVFIIDLVTLIMKDKILWIDDINEILSTETKAEAAPAEETTVEDAPVEDAPVQETTDAE